MSGSFGAHVSFINIKLFICMYANAAVFNPKVINNLDADNNSAQSEVRGGGVSVMLI